MSVTTERRGACGVPAPSPASGPSRTRAWSPAERERLHWEARRLREKTERLRLENVKALLDLSYTFATFADSKCGEDLVARCRAAAAKACDSVRGLLARADLTELENAGLEERIERLRAALSGAEHRDPQDSVELSEHLPAAAPLSTGANAGRGRGTGLTAREIEVLKCIAEGHATKEVGAMLGITFKTAACHRYRMMEKLGIHDTASLVRYAIRTGLIRA